MAAAGAHLLRRVDVRDMGRAAARGEAGGVPGGPGVAGGIGEGAGGVRRHQPLGDDGPLRADAAAAARGHGAGEAGDGRGRSHGGGPRERAARSRRHLRPCVRPDGEHDVFDVPADGGAEGAGRLGADWWADRELDDVRAGRGAEAGACGSAGRAVRGRRGPCPRVRGPAGADGGALRAQPLRRRRAALPHGRHGAVEGRRDAGLRGPARRAGEGARLPGGGGRGGGGADGARGGERGGGGGERRGSGGQATGGVRGGEAGGIAGGRQPASAPEAAATGVHGAVGVRGAGHVAADACRQGGPQGPAGAGSAGFES